MPTGNTSLFLAFPGLGQWEAQQEMRGSRREQSGCFFLAPFLLCTTSWALVVPPPMIPHRLPFSTGAGDSSPLLRVSGSPSC